MNQLIGKKIGMTQVYTDDNVLVPVTVIEAGPCPIVQIKTPETDGYHAVQIGYGAKKEKNTSKSMQGHFKKAGVEQQRILREIRLEDAAEAELGQALTVEIFQDLEKVDVIANTKGRGFSGVVKRWNFHGGPASHGSMFHRRGGSYGMCQWPGEIQKGKKMPGHYGTEQRTVQNLKVVKVLADKNLILVKGSVPGANGTTVIVRQAIKQRKSA
ncbi:MAG: large subunit ribosomal protein L3 [Puniceicoccaceae bacterium 5H]|nr:MAG: large subunit ribosomal protein L3 [Puniceicoccaceae bacterium 5H]